MTHHRTRRPSLFAIVALVVVSGFANVSSAHAERPSISDLINQLDSQRLADREEASQKLAEMDITLDMARRANVSIESLSAEQRSRLDQALYQRFKRVPRAGLGVQFDTTFVQGVRLQAVTPTFPAAGILMPGDVVLKAQGVGFASYINQQAWQSFRRRILSFEPGEEMSMVIKRGQRTLDLNVPLGSYADLGTTTPLVDDDLSAAWSLRRSRLGFELRDPGRIKVADQTTPWPPMTPLDQTRLTPELGLIAGGAPGARPTLRIDQLSRRLKQRLVAQSRIVIREANPRQGGAAVGLRTTVPQNNQRQLLIRQVSQWQAIRDDAQRRASNPALNERDRSQAAQQMVRAQMQLTLIQQRLDAIDQR